VWGERTIARAPVGDFEHTESGEVADAPVGDSGRAAGSDDAGETPRKHDWL
jgi:hypothetical protein